MAAGPVREALSNPRTQRWLSLGLLAALALAGHGLYLGQVDPSPTPFLPAQAVSAREDVAAVFPNATEPALRVVLVADEGRSVLTPGVLTALTGLRNRITSHENVTPVLAHEEAIGSVLEPLFPHLAGRPGEWDDQAVGDALETVTATPEGRRSLALYLDQRARFAGAETSAQATVLVVRLEAGASPEALGAAQETVRALAQAIGSSDLQVTTDAPQARQEAGRSLAALWVPLVSAGLLLAAGLALRLKPRRGAAWALLWFGGAGAGLLSGALVDHSTPVSLAGAHLGAAVGLTLALLLNDAPSWLAATPALPLVALVGWPPAGTGELALVVAVATLMAALASRGPGMLDPGPAPRLPSRLRPGPGRPGPWSVTLVVFLLVGPMLVLAFAGVDADHAQAGWEGGLPSNTEAGRAEQALSVHFPGPGPVSSFTVAAWGPVTEPGFLAAVDETGQRLGRLSLAATGGEVHSILSLARDWATDSSQEDPEDVYDEDFAERWRNATQGGDVPVRHVPQLYAALGELDPEGLAGTVTIASEDDPGVTGVVLLRQRVSLPGVVPRPGEAVAAAIQPLVASSERVAVTGSGLEIASAQTAVAGTTSGALLAAALAAIVAGLAWTGYRAAPSPLASILAITGVSAALGTQAVLALSGLPARPLTLLVPAVAAALALALAAPLIRRVAGELAGAPSTRGAVEAALDGRTLAHLGGAIPVGLVAVVLATQLAPGLRVDGLAVLVAGAVAVVTASSVPRGLTWAWSHAGEEASGAHPRAARAPSGRIACPVCQRRSVTGASRCRSCGTWNLVEACSAHPSALEISCADCGANLDEPHFV